MFFPRLALDPMALRSSKLVRNATLRARGKIGWTNMKKQGSEAPLLFHGLIHEKRQYPSVIVDFSAAPFIAPKGATLPWVQ